VLLLLEQAGVRSKLKAVMNYPWIKGLSLISRGTHYQIRIATMLLGVFPALVVCFLVLTASFPTGAFSLAAKIIIGCMALLLALSGYAILRTYPKNITKLRGYLRDMVEGELPDKVALEHSEDDICAIENYLNLVLTGLRDKIQLLAQQLQRARAMQSALTTQQQELLAAERQRVMIQSLGTLCHHIAQPLTVLSYHLYYLRQLEPTPAMQQELAECENTFSEVVALLDRMRQVSTYRTEPYHIFTGAETPGVDNTILDITEPAAAH